MGRRIIVVLLLLVLTACGGSVGSSQTTSSSGDAAGAGVPSAAVSAAAAPAAEPAEKPQMTQDQIDIEGEQRQAYQSGQAASQRLVIRTATLRALVQDVNAVEASVRAVAEGRGGFVLSSQASGQDDRRTATVSFKVPAERFDEALDAVTKLAIKVDSLQVQGQDVTDEYVDLESRLRNLRAVESRLLQFLTDAKRTEDALTVNGQLTDIQGQIEQAQGRIAYLKQSAALSTITVDLYAEPVVEVLPEPGWAPGTTARAALKSLVSFGQGLADIMIVVAVWVPVWLPLLLGLIILLRRQRRPVAPTTPSDPGIAQP